MIPSEYRSHRGQPGRTKGDRSMGGTLMKRKFLAPTSLRNRLHGDSESNANNMRTTENKNVINEDSTGELSSVDLLIFAPEQILQSGECPRI